jgi:Flp pilus assembly protein TadG
MRLFSLFRRYRGRHRSRGQSLVEFAIILPIMLLFLAAVLDLGRVFYATITLNNAAREGAFQAAQTPDSFDAGQPCNTATNLVVCRVQLEARGSGVTIAATDVDLTCSPNCNAVAGNTVTVGVTGQFTLVTPLLSMFFGGQTIPMGAEAIAQLEYLPPPNTATLPPGPVAQISTSVSDLTVQFDGTGSSGTPDAYVWDFGDGNTGSGATATHTYGAPGTYTVILTVVNLAGSDDHSVTVDVGTATPTPTGSAAPTATPTATPTPFNCFPPNVIGKSPASAQADLINAGFNVLSYGDLTTGQKDKIQSQNPDHTQCLTEGATITLHYRPS